VNSGDAEVAAVHGSLVIPFTLMVIDTNII